MKKVLLITLISYCFLFPQREKIDSLKNLLLKTSYDEKRLLILLDLCNEFTTLDINENQEYLDEAFELANKFNDTSALARVYLYYGSYYLSKGDYSKSAENLILSVKISEKNNYKETFEKALNTLSIVYLRNKKFDDAKRIFNELIQLAKRSGNKNNYIKYNLNYATLLGELGDLDQSEKILLEILPLTDDLILYKTVTLNSLSMIYNIENKYEKSLKYSFQAIELSKKAGNVLLEIEVLTNVANSLFGLKRFNESIELNRKVLSLAEKNNLPLQQSNAYGNLYLNYEGIGDYKNAFENLKKHTMLKDSIQNENIARQINELQTKFETEKKETALLNKEKELQNQSKLNFAYLVIIIILFLLIITIILFYFRQRLAYQSLVKMNLSILKEQKKFDLLKSYLKGILGNKFEDFTTQETLIEQNKTQIIPDTMKNKILEKLESFIEGKRFLDINISLEKLALEFETNTKYLSQIIHEVYNNSFADFINELRVNEARKLLNNPEYDHYTIEGIGNLAGFNSKQSFYSSFKKFTGVTPSFYKKQSKI